MTDERWNAEIHLYPSDRWFAWVERLIPRAVHPNHLTVLRMALVPVVVYFLHQRDYAVGAPLFVIAAATDWLDGLLARLRRQITEWGIIYDPIADKLLVGAVLLVIVFEHVNVYLGYALFVLEAMALIANFIRYHKGIISPSNKWGKAKMLFEVSGIALLLLALWSGEELFISLSAGTLALALIAALASVYWRIR
jgi:CDP-diacylglycerol---glycerol-3-phosphate 3-phosphatidyltransferase